MAALFAKSMYFSGERHIGDKMSANHRKKLLVFRWSQGCQSWNNHTPWGYNLVYNLITTMYKVQGFSCQHYSVNQTIPYMEWR